MENAQGAKRVDLPPPLTSQPSLSRQIRDLEDEIGAQVLTRSPRGIELTSAVERFSITPGWSYRRLKRQPTPKVARRAFNSRRCRRTDRPAAGIKKRKIELDYIPTGL
jgi:hypothetical protein